MKYVDTTLNKENQHLYICNLSDQENNITSYTKVFKYLKYLKIEIRQ